MALTPLHFVLTKEVPVGAAIELNEDGARDFSWDVKVGTGITGDLRKGFSLVCGRADWHVGSGPSSRMPTG